MGKYQKLAGKLKGTLNTGGGSSGGGAVYTGGGGGSSEGALPSNHAEFKRILVDTLVEKAKSTGGISTIQHIDEALETLEPFIHDSAYKADYNSLLEDKKVLEQVANDQEFSSVIDLGNAFDKIASAKIANYGNVDNYVLGVDTAYEEGMKEIEAKINDYTYNGFDTTTLKKSLDALKQDKIDNFDTLKDAYQDSDGAEVPVQGFAWYIKTNPYTGKLESPELVDERFLRGAGLAPAEGIAATNIKQNGVPVFFNENVIDGQRAVSVLGSDLFYDEYTKTWVTEDAENFDIRDLEYQDSPKVDVGTPARDNYGNFFYYGGDKWYKVEDGETMNDLMSSFPTTEGKKDYTNKDGHAYKHMTVLSNKQLASLESFTSVEGNKKFERMITKDVLKGTRSINEPEEIAPPGTMLGQFQESSGINFNEEIGKIGSALEEQYEGSLLEKVETTPGKIAGMVGRIPEGFQAGFDESLNQFNKGLKGVSLGIAKSAGEGVKSLIGKQQPRRSTALKPSKAKASIGKRTSSIISGQFRG